jgi:hypothetical protein
MYQFYPQKVGFLGKYNYFAFIHVIKNLPLVFCSGSTGAGCSTTLFSAGASTCCCSGSSTYPRVKHLLIHELAKITPRKWSEWIRVFAWGACSFSWCNVHRTHGEPVVYFRFLQPLIKRRRLAFVNMISPRAACLFLSLYALVYAAVDV